MSNNPLGRMAPEFSLPALGGGRFNLADLRGQMIVLNFWSSECAWSRRADVLLVYRQPRWQSYGVRVVGVASNFNETETAIRFEAEKRHLQYPLLLDADQRVADLYGALTTPHFFVLDRQRVVRYSGALDDATSAQPDGQHLYVDEAVSMLLRNAAPQPEITSPYGCPINRLRASATRAVQKSEG